MRYIIEDKEFIHVIDFDRLNKHDGGFIDEYHPTARESIEAFLHLLENIHSRDQISAALADMKEDRQGAE